MITEPITPAAYALGGSVAAGTLMGMPPEAVIFGAVATAAVTMLGESRSTMLVVSYVIIGGLLGGAFAPPLAHLLIEAYAPESQYLARDGMHVSHVLAPVMIGLLWQVVIKLGVALWPSFERHVDELLQGVVDFILRRPKR